MKINCAAIPLLVLGVWSTAFAHRVIPITIVSAHVFVAQVVTPGRWVI